MSPMMINIYNTQYVAVFCVGKKLQVHKFLGMFLEATLYSTFFRV